MKPLYHLSHIDLDGYSCQLITTMSYENIICYNANYGAEMNARLKQIINAITIADEDADILITDLNLTTDEAKWLEKSVLELNSKGLNISIQLLDHHGGGSDTAKLFEWYHLDTEKCGTLLTYEYALKNFNTSNFPKWLKSYVERVNAVDLWHQEQHEEFEFGKVLMRLLYEARELNRYMFSDEDRKYKIALLIQAAEYIGKEDANITVDENIHQFKKNYFKKDKNNTLDNLATKEIVRLVGEIKEELVIYYRGYKGCLTYALGNTSIIGNGILTEYPEFDFCMDVGMRGTISFRASNHADVSKIAKDLAKGGGHPNASGGRLERFKDIFEYSKTKMVIEDLIVKKELDPQRLITPLKVEV